MVMVPSLDLLLLTVPMVLPGFHALHIIYLPRSRFTSCLFLWLPCFYFTGTLLVYNIGNIDFRWRPLVKLRGKTGHVHGMNSKQLPKRRKNAHSAEACLAFGL